MSDNVHPSMLPLPAGEVDNRIGKANETIRGEFADTMRNIETKVDQLATNMALMMGTPETPGVLARVEKTLERVEATTTTTASRAAEDDAFRKAIIGEVAELKEQIKSLQSLITVMRFFWRGISWATQSSSGGTSKAIYAILAGVAWIVIVQLLHTVFPAMRFSILHHHLSF